MPLTRATAVAALCLLAAPAGAGNSLVPAGVPVAVARSTMKLTPPVEMNRLGSRPGRQAELWTLDGLPLNRFLLVAGVPAGQPMLRERDRKDKPLPRFDPSVDATGLFDFFAQSLTAEVPGVTVTLVALEPAEHAGCSGVIASWRAVTIEDEVERSGRALLCTRGGLFHAVSLSAPSLHYFERDLPVWQALVESIHF